LSSFFLSEHRSFNFFTPSQKIGESYHDNFIACAALSLGKIKYVDSPLYDYRQHANNICGHRVPSHREGGRAKINSQPFHSLLKNFQSTLLYYRSQYYGDFIRRILIAQVISLRCQGLSGKKKKILERFASFEKKWYAILLETVGNRILQKGAIAFGNDSRLLKSALSMKLLSLL